MSPSDSQPSRLLRLRADVAVGRAGPVRGAHEDLADLARRQLVAVFVEDPDLRADLRLADRAAVREPLGAGDHRHALRLGAGVELVHALGPEPLDERLLEPAGHGAPRCKMRCSDDTS